MRDLLAQLDQSTPVLIYGPTASGKSALALEIAERRGGIIVNADASQVFGNWQVLTARPGPDDVARAAHSLYGMLAHDAGYSVGHWLRDVAPLLSSGARPIIVGGTGLYFRALTEGLAEIPPIPAEIRAQADEIRAQEGHEALLAGLDPVTRAGIDSRNPMRVQRAWEVQHATGRSLAAWQADTPPPLLPLPQCHAIHVAAERDWLNTRIAARFEQMIAAGALEEARANLPLWDPGLLSMRAIGARELVAHLQGALTLEEACARATIATQQFAKRQRTWGRARMACWRIWRPDLP